MKDSIENFNYDELMKQFNFIKGNDKSQYKSKYIQDKELEQRRNYFLNRSKKEFTEHVENSRELEYIKPYIGIYADVVPETFEERRDMLATVINNLFNDTNRGAIQKGTTLAVSKDWRKSVLGALNRMNVYLENIGKQPNQYEELKTTDLQGLLKSQFTKEDGVTPNKQRSLEQYVKQYKFINTLENIVFATDRDYTSGLMTPDDLARINEVETYVEPTKTTTQKWYKDDDFNKLEREIMRRNKGDFAQCDDISIAILLSRRWGLRVDTTVQLTIDDIKAKDGIIKVPAAKNKSGVSYKAITLDDDATKMLGAFVQRAMERGQDTLITASKDSLYRSFKRIEKKAGIKPGLYKGQRFHSLRRAFADELYAEYRETGYSDDREGCKTFVNSALGHNYKELKNLSCYVIDMW